MILVVDVGNTQMVFGLYLHDVLQWEWRLSSRQQLTSDEFALQLEGMFNHHGHDHATVSGIMVASVVPHLDRALADACTRIFHLHPAFIGSSDVKTGIAIEYKNPREVGADRIANAVAARERFGSPVIIVDCGTATTFDLVSPAGNYAGGLIVPGLNVALDAMCQTAARLPEVSFQKVEYVFARDTVSSIQAGSYWFAIEGLGGIIRRLKQENGYQNAKVVFTGGLAAMIAGDLPDVNEYLPHLTLDGLALLAVKHFAEGC
ncbi:MAG: type III pantothenate kinase [Mariprofundaceae bacterium]